MQLDLLTWLATAVLGGAVALAGQMAVQRFVRRSDRRRRAEERSEQAAETILQAFDEARRRYEHHSSADPLPDYDDVQDLVTRVEMASVHILDGDVRVWLEDHFADILANMDAVAKWGEGFPRQVTYVLRREARKMLGNMLRGKKAVVPSKEINKYIAAIREDATIALDHLERQREEQKRLREEAKRRNDG